MQTRIKICGLTRPEDAVDAGRAGVDAVGLVFHPPSPRNLPPEQAVSLVQAVPPFVTVVGLFMNAKADWIRRCLDTVSLDVLQFHGNEPAAFCRSFGRRYIKAVAMGAVHNPSAYVQDFPDASGFLFDSHGGERMGGTGERFEWSRLPTGLKTPLILAGGLNPENVAEGVRQVRPYAVDVSSGVESAKGIKSADRIAEFVRGVKRGEAG